MIYVYGVYHALSKSLKQPPNLTEKGSKQVLFLRMQGGPLPPSVLPYGLIYMNQVHLLGGLLDRFMVFNATFNNISVILWRSYWWRKPGYQM